MWLRSGCLVNAFRACGEPCSSQVDLLLVPPPLDRLTRQVFSVSSRTQQGSVFKSLPVWTALEPLEQIGTRSELLLEHIQRCRLSLSISKSEMFPTFNSRRRDAYIELPLLFGCLSLAEAPSLWRHVDCKPWRFFNVETWDHGGPLC